MLRNYTDSDRSRGRNVQKDAQVERYTFGAMHGRLMFPTVRSDTQLTDSKPQARIRSATGPRAPFNGPDDSGQCQPYRRLCHGPVANGRINKGTRQAALARLPASTLVIVSGITRPEFLVEVEVTSSCPQAVASMGEVVSPSGFEPETY